MEEDPARRISSERPKLVLASWLEEGRGEPRFCASVAIAAFTPRFLLLRFSSSSRLSLLLSGRNHDKVSETRKGKTRHRRPSCPFDLSLSPSLVLPLLGEARGPVLLRAGRVSFVIVAEWVTVMSSSLPFVYPPEKPQR